MFLTFISNAERMTVNIQQAFKDHFRITIATKTQVVSEVLERSQVMEIIKTLDNAI